MVRGRALEIMSRGLKPRLVLGGLDVRAKARTYLRCNGNGNGNRNGNRNRKGKGKGQG